MKPIFTNDIPEAFWKWYKALANTVSYITMEITGYEISVVRTRQVAMDEDIIKNKAFGKFIKDSSGCYFERTYKPKFYLDTNTVKSA